MREREGIILGFDPGGKENFAWAICYGGQDDLTLLKAGLSSDAQGAFDGVIKGIRSLDIPGTPSVLAAGVDAPMLWSTAGDREVDRVLRKALPFGQKNLVLHINSIPGSCLVQGTLLGKFLHERYGGDGLGITESHPSALFHLLEAQGKSQELEALTEDLEDYEVDAAICAYGAWSMLQGFSGWQNLYLLEPQPLQPFGSPVSYWMPVA